MGGVREEGAGSTGFLTVSIEIIQVVNELIQNGLRAIFWLLFLVLHSFCF